MFLILSELTDEISRISAAKDMRKAFEDLLILCQSWLNEKSSENVSMYKHEPLLSSAIEQLLQQLKVMNQSR